VVQIKAPPIDQPVRGAVDAGIPFLPVDPGSFQIAYMVGGVHLFISKKLVGGAIREVYAKG